MKYTIGYTEEYEEWFENHSKKTRYQIAARLKNITDHGHFGKIGKIDSGLWELKWKNGMRIYYAELVSNYILLLHGGNKNGQEKDINRARNIREKAGIQDQ